jgi:hypothetical protein
MQVVLNDNGTAELLRPGEFTRFEAVLRRGEKELPAVLAPEGDTYVWVEDAWLRRELAGARLAPEWEPQYEKMVHYARSKGWVREGPLAIRAHISWKD